jgi:type I restriction enzyme S subunit
MVVRSGDVLVSGTRPNLNAVALVSPDLDNTICSTGFSILRAKPDVDPGYLFVYAQCPGFVESLSGLVNGALYPAVTDRQVRAQWVPVPPLDEQRRIAAEVQAKLEHIENARAAATAQTEAARALTAAYLRGVFESAVARKWPSAELGSLAIAVQNGIYKPPEFYGHGATFIRMYNIPNASWSLSYETLAQVEVSEAEQDRFGLQPGDLLVSRVNSFELVGKCAHVDGKAAGFVFENMLIRVRLSERVNPLFMAQQMSTSSVRSQIQRVAKRAIGQASINSDDIRQIRLAVPPRQVQDEVSEYVEKKVASARELEATIEAAEKAIALAPGAVLNSVFGEGA